MMSDTTLNIRLHKIESRLDALEEDNRTLREALETVRHLTERRAYQARVVAATDTGGLITRRDMQRMKGVSAMTVKAWSKYEDFPAPVELGYSRYPAKWDRGAFEVWYESHVLRPQVRIALIRKQEQEAMACQKGEK